MCFLFLSENSEQENEQDFYGLYVIITSFQLLSVLVHRL